MQGLNTQKPKLHIENMPQKRKEANASNSTPRPALGIRVVLSDCGKI
jgi:hypothetical protein